MRLASKKLVYVTKDGASEERPAEGVEYIAIRAALSLAQRAQMQASLVEIDTKTSETQARMDRYLMAFNEAAIAGWFLIDDETGQPLPFARETIGQLDAADPLVDRALKEFTERNPTLSQGSGASG